MLPVPSFTPLLETSDVISQILSQQSKSMDIVEDESAEAPRTKLLTQYDEDIHSILVPTLEKFKPMDVANLLEAAFKLKLFSAQNDLGTNIPELQQALFPCLDLLLRCAELDLCDPIAPLTMIEELLDVQTVNNTEFIYNYLESRIRRLTANMSTVKGKGLTLLRLCNELLRRLSKAKDNVFCGRILMLLSNVFPLGERSGVNLKGEFNVENITPIEDDNVAIVPSLTPSTPSEAPLEKGQRSSQNGESMEVDGVEDHEAISRKRDVEFYKEFWGLQRLFANPALLANSADNMSKLKVSMEATLTKFSDAVRDERKRRPSMDASDTKNPNADQEETLSTKSPAKRKQGQLQEEMGERSQRFPKFLTSPQLLKLEIFDPYFRKHILVQFMIILYCLQNQTASAKEKWASLPTPNKAFQPQWTLEESDNSWIEDIKPKVFKALKLAGVDTNDSGFADSIRHAFEHEKDWYKWKAESCHTFEKTPLSADEIKTTKSKRQKLQDAMAPLKQKLGCASLTSLWDEIEEQSFGDESALGTFRPPTSIESYVSDVQHLQKREENMRKSQPKSAPTEEESRELDKARLWRGLRVGVEQYLHIYGAHAGNLDYSVKDLMTDIKKDIEDEAAIEQNGGLPLPKIEEAPAPGEDEGTPTATNDTADNLPPKETEEEAPKDAVETPKDAVETPKDVAETPKDVAESPKEDVKDGPTPMEVTEEEPKPSTT